MSLIRSVVCVALLCCVSFVSAQDEGKKKKAKGPESHPAIVQIEKGLDAAGLDEAAKAKVKPILDGFRTKLIDVQKKFDGSLTEEQKKARSEAGKQAKTDGKKGKEAAQAVDAAMKLTEEQLKTKKELGGKVKELTGELKTALKAALTPEQAEKAGIK